MKPECIAKSGLYFPANSGGCEGDLMRIPNFWRWAKSGDLNAYICAAHKRNYELGNQYKSYLYQRLRDAEPMPKETP